MLLIPKVHGSTRFLLPGVQGIFHIPVVHVTNTKILPRVYTVITWILPRVHTGEEQCLPLANLLPFGWGRPQDRWTFPPTELLHLGRLLVAHSHLPAAFLPLADLHEVLPCAQELLQGTRPLFLGTHLLLADLLPLLLVADLPLGSLADLADLILGLALVQPRAIPHDSVQRGRFGHPDQSDSRVSHGTVQS
jgi:hypothetical protein